MECPCKLAHFKILDVKNESIIVDYEGDEMGGWLKRRRRSIEKFVILDDMEILGFDDNFVRIDRGTGLVRADIPRILRILQ